MPNWCDNQVEITAKESTIQWISQHLEQYAGRRFDEPFTLLRFAFENGYEVWYSLLIFVRTAGSGFNDFLKMILDKFTNVQIQGSYWIEGGMGAGDYELWTDSAGKKNETFKRIEQTCYYEDAYDDITPTEEELHHNGYEELEKEELNQWWFEEAFGADDIPMPWLIIPREEELNYNIYELLEQEELAELNESFPDYGELMFDDCRLSYLYPYADDFGYKIYNYHDWEALECNIYDDLRYHQWIEVISEIPTEEELNYNGYEELEQEENMDLFLEVAFWEDGEPMYSIYFEFPESKNSEEQKYLQFVYMQGQYATEKWKSYNDYLISIYAQEEEYEQHLLEQEFEDSKIYWLE